MKYFSRIYILASVILSAYSLNGAEPANYYSKCENKGGAALLTALFNTVSNHTVVSYDGLWEVYNTSDVRPNGTVWDMYSTKQWTPGKERCGNYKNVGDCINREHSMPKSWFNDARPMYSDAFHLYPTDGKVNGQRSNYPYGECSRGTTLASNGSVKALGRLGTSTFPGYTGTVFEPDDEYKGDFARSYFYMAAAYNDKIAGWTYAEAKPMLAGNAYPAFTSWAVELLLKWHRQDPVSEKEKTRNEAVYAYQKNRNPFIDHPEMVEYIWGDKKNETWSSTAAQQAVLSTPANNSTLSLGTVAVGVSRTFAVNVKGSFLKNSLSVSLTDNTGSVTVSPSTLSASSVNSDAGATVSVTVNAKAAGTLQSVLNLVSTGDKISTKVTLNINAMEGLPATEPSQVTDESFIARWTYIGGEDSNGCYTLYVLNMDEEYIDTYPRSVPARDEEYLVDELEPETDYIFYICNATTTSNIMYVTTAAPIPSIQILYDGDLELSAEPGLPSDAAELLLDIENIFTDITFSVDEPFQLSSDKGNWTTSLIVDPREDRIYIRIFGEQGGTYTSSIRAQAGEYVSDNAEVTGTIVAESTFFEDFENGNATGNYSTSSYTGSACKWKFSDAGTYLAKNEAYEGEKYLRFGKTSSSSAEMNEDKTDGIGAVTLQAAGWSKADGESRFKLQYSTDEGKTWTDSGSEVTIPAPASTTITYAPYTFTVNQAGNVRLRILQTYGSRMCFDSISATGYRSSNAAGDIFGDDRGTGWDAYCLDGSLVIESESEAAVAVHGVDGVTYVTGFVGVGTSAYSLRPGLYIVVIGNSTRRVLVK